MQLSSTCGYHHEEKLFLVWHEFLWVFFVFVFFFLIHPVFPPCIWKSVSLHSFMDFWHIIFDNIKIFWWASNHGLLAIHSCSHPLPCYITKGHQNNPCSVQQPIWVISPQLLVCNEGGPCCTRPKLLVSFDLFSWSFSVVLQYIYSAVLYESFWSPVLKVTRFGLHCSQRLPRCCTQVGITPWNKVW